MNEIQETIKKILASDKGILAADASTPTMTKRFEKAGIESTEETRRQFRQLLVTTPDLEKYIGGIILFDETIRQRLDNGKTFSEHVAGRGILPGIKVDEGTEPFKGSENEKITKGLDGLAERLGEYVGMGAKFTKWRVVINIGEGIPTSAGIQANAGILAEYAAESQEAGLVPIVEPEVLMDGTHTIKKCEEVTIETLLAVFKSLKTQGVEPEGMILKTNMVLPGKESGQTVSAQEIAQATIRALRSSVPTQVPAIVFLSGGQEAKLATERLNEICKTAGVPWDLGFSFERALEGPAMEIWQGKAENVSGAQMALRHRAKMNSLAVRGEYKKELENE
ncbi:MAG: Fructose-bisphosphate aldolase [Candidatus Woesebacteria bacterium GW2011_GWC2_47_16]|uniref:Probable fructose-bisphosphate aldolase class 1 n=9 Tax=Candidatus Woeseibacteriota TaxID=1752722 RepID=A0A0G1VMJ9_9BACT|nr:MAG: Fructose-bisphosphate aldolase [Candidatus Woesebacteria bacterium GW2011_GWE1_45_18]KKU25103.1 MAG: Fructose-bisphosphate aldolase [Candidatus Woesebacteria bacterium GW2011_GWF1_46_13]KKU65316.1 MAG: Fructose-bisphosphate aldolase [Candidatus Woesebacteria bacterium GW2011_GWC2_47_16]KKU71265.1 MAG: Fructose-bisphosphate aldolase [Candidatus Woesebacteria bacterium GW2011_GWD1_47_21]OGM77301.1 MAG: fructose-bisphosphate aldolase [Candidatus Woesebacteria bacterium RIFOXYA1_FULL_48_16]